MLVVVGLVILGPERLPGAVNWFFTALRRDWTDAQEPTKARMMEIVAAVISAAIEDAAD